MKAFGITSVSCGLYCGVVRVGFTTYSLLTLFDVVGSVVDSVIHVVMRVGPSPSCLRLTLRGWVMILVPAGSSSSLLAKLDKSR